MKKGKKSSGGKYIKRRKKKHYELSGQKNTIKLGERREKIKRIRGGSRKRVVLRTNIVNVKLNGKGKKVMIKNVLETPSNRFLARQNVITKGTIVETEIGKVKITNRPSQESVLNGILVK